MVVLILIAAFGRYKQGQEEQALRGLSQEEQDKILIERAKNKQSWEKTWDEIMAEVREKDRQKTPWEKNMDLARELDRMEKARVLDSMERERRAIDGYREYK